MKGFCSKRYILEMEQPDGSHGTAFHNSFPLGVPDHHALKPSFNHVIGSVQLGEDRKVFQGDILQIMNIYYFISWNLLVLEIVFHEVL